MELFLFVSYKLLIAIEFCETIPLVMRLNIKKSVPMKDLRLQMVRKLAHDVNGPLGNTAAFIDLALQQFNDVVEKQEKSKSTDADTGLAEMKMGIEFLKLSVPSVVQLQRNMRMWSALHQIVAEEYGVQLRKLDVAEYIDRAYEQISVFLSKKGVIYEIKGSLSNQLIADAELLGLITFYIFDLAIAISERNNTVQFELSEDLSNDEIKIAISLKLDADYPKLSEQLASRFGNDIESLPQVFDQGIIKPLAYGSIFVPTAVEAMGGTFEFSVVERLLKCDLSFKVN